MRVTNKIIYDTIKYSLANITEDLARSNRVIATGRRINSPSDDPVGITQALHIRSTLANLEQLERNVTFGKSWLTASESALNQVQDLISNAKSLCVQMATATTGAAQREAASENVQVAMDELVSLANSDVNGHYIFAGSKTESAPFKDDGTYQGDDKPFTIKIGRDATLAIGNDGDAVFGTLFNTLSDLKNALSDNDVPGIQGAMSKLDDHFDQITTKISDLGAKTVRMEIKEKIFQDLNLTNTERLSGIEDADIADAIIGLKEKQVAYQAVLVSASKIMKLSLVDFL